jgi:Ni/Fe-hydrogenase subunit HybB-like protein
MFVLFFLLRPLKINIYKLYISLMLDSSVGISPEESRVVGKRLDFFSIPIRRLKPIERPAEEASLIPIYTTIISLSLQDIGRIFTGNIIS